MRLLIQRVREASVTVAGERVAAIGPGLLVLAGFGTKDGPELPGSRVWSTLIEKMVGMRIFQDDAGKMNLGIEDVGGEILLVSQFTLYADCRKGRRPSFHPACDPSIAADLYAALVQAVEKRLPGRVQQGIFAADMDVALTNWGPVTIMLDSEEFSD